MQQALNAAAAAFTNAILRTLFGFQPPLPFGAANASSASSPGPEPELATAAALFEPRMARGFNGSLEHLRWRGAEWTVSSDALAGLEMRRESGS